MELSPPPLGISEAAAAPPARCAHSGSGSQRGCCACLRGQDAPVPRGVWSRPPPGRRSPARLGRCPTGSPPGQSLRNEREEEEEEKKNPSSSPRERGRPRQNGAFLDSSCRARWQGLDAGGPGPGGGAGPTGGRLRRRQGSWQGAGQGAAAATGALTRTPTRARSRLRLRLMRLQEAGGWRRLVH